MSSKLSEQKDAGKMPTYKSNINRPVTDKLYNRAQKGTLKLGPTKALSASRTDLEIAARPH